MIRKESSQLRNIRLTVEYDGTRYVGWQRQRNGVSVQECLEDALSRHLGEPVRTTCAGRTDAGVHARGQVVNFRTRCSLAPRAVQHGLFPLLPRDITVLDASEVPAHFDARKSAILRWYRYFLLNRSVAPAVGAAYLTHVRGRLNSAAMEAAASVFEGHHDFSAFRAVTCTAVRTRLTMQRPVITFAPDGLIVMDFRCRSFLQNMVRIMAGAIVACGRGKLTPSDIRKMLDTGSRQNEAVTLAPNGLFLWRVFYSRSDGGPEPDSGT
ncbi:MAG: tRNA pseudouridine(38-40) synthase TruA [Candidatus Sumerlaeaceae bacterium]|nr:tRNA pseudouridine(38-40) synthase TruA [Candidatus Sumerlaeaceae bacterium]